jgi:hypothetical protein
LQGSVAARFDRCLTYTLLHTQPNGSPPPCGPDPEPYLESISQYEEVGYDQIYIHQVGLDQEGFFWFFEREILPEPC